MFNIFKPARTTAKPRHEIHADYVESMRAQGYRQVKVWVPEGMAAWFRRVADQARALQSSGVDPVEHAPKSLLGCGDRP
jgi:hypothetical protein